MTRNKRKEQPIVLKSLNEVNTAVAKGSHFSVIMLAILLIAGLMIGFVWQKVKITQIAVEIEDLRRQELNLKERNEKKRAKVLNLLNDSRIIKLAEKRLNMVFPPYEVINLSTNSKLREND